MDSRAQPKAAFATVRAINCVPAKGGKLVNYCQNNEKEACRCGEEEKSCAIGLVCRNGECVDRNSLKVFENEGYDLSNGLWICNNSDGCICGKAPKNGKMNCETGKFCINGICHKDRYFRKLGEKMLYFRLQEHGDVDNFNASRDKLWSLMFIDATQAICQGDWTEVYQEIDGKRIDFCYDEQYKAMTVGDLLKNCGVGPQPENVASLYCELDFLKGSLGHSPSTTTKIRVSGWKE